jgi:hypothetical protein
MRLALKKSRMKTNATDDQALRQIKEPNVTLSHVEMSPRSCKPFDGAEPQFVSGLDRAASKLRCDSRSRLGEFQNLAMLPTPAGPLV